MPRLQHPPATLFERLTLELASSLRSSGTHGDAYRKRWQKDPFGWMVEELGVAPESIRWSLLPEYKKHKWDGDVDPLLQVLQALTTHRRIGVESGANTGKTHVLVALVTLWWLAVWENGSVVHIAPKQDQLKLHGWKRIAEVWPRFHMLFPNALLTDLLLRMKPPGNTWSAVGFPVGVGANEESATRAQGFHDEHQLIIFEEGPAVHPSIYVAAENTSSAEHNVILVVGNPDHQLDPCHMFCITPGTKHVRISALDHPNVVCDRTVVKGAVSASSIAYRARKFGLTSRIYRSRVQGLAPAEATDALIKLDWCKAAAARGYTLDPQAPRALGVDVANSKDGDLGAVARGQGFVCLSVEDFPCPDANVLGHKLAIEMKTQGIAPERCGVDNVGVGSGCVNALREDGLEVAALMSGSAMQIGLEHLFHPDEQFLNLRAQMWWLARLDLQHGRVILPDDEELFNDLVTPRWGTRKGKIWVEEKEKTKALLGRSPNKGDAFVYWNWVRQVAAVASIGGGMVSF